MDISTLKKIDSDKVIEYLFYLLVLLYFVGKVFKPITFFIDAFFLYSILKNQNKKEYFLKLYEEHKSFFNAIFIFIGYLLFQSVFLELKYQTFKSSFETIMYLILVFAAIYNFNSLEKVRKMIFVSYTILFFLALDSFYQYFTGTDFFGFEMYAGRRITAWSDMPKVNLMMGEFFGLLFASVFVFKGIEKKIAVFMLLSSFVLFIIAGNRSPLLALFPVALLVFLFLKNKKILIGFLVTTVLVFFVSLFNPQLKKAYSVFVKPVTNESTSGRLIIYNTGVEMIKDNLIFGIGSGNFRFYYKEYLNKIDKSKYSERSVKHNETVGQPHVHSVFLDMFISYGVFGVLLYIYLIYQIYKYFIRDNEIGLIASIGFFYCITPLQFGRNFTMGDWQFITYLGLIFLIIMSNYKKIELIKV